MILFDCDWVSEGKGIKKDDDGFTLARFTNIKRHNEPFILASQAEQVFYVEDLDQEGWHVVVKTTPRAIQEKEDLEMIDVDMYSPSDQEDLTSSCNLGDITWVREGVHGTTVDMQMEVPTE